MRKNDEQVAKERSRVWLSFRGPVLLFLVCFVANLGVAIEGPRWGAGERPWPDTWSKILGGSTLLATVAAIVGYIFQVVFRRTLGSLVGPAKVDICDTCHRVKQRDRQSKCECGGTFDDFDKWTWIDENEGGPHSG